MGLSLNAPGVWGGMSYTLEGQIHAKQCTLNHLLQTLQAIKLEFLQRLGRFVASEMMRQIDLKVAEEFEVTRGFSDLALKQVKDAVSEIVSKIPADVVEFVAQDRWWWHAQQPLPIVGDPNSLRSLDKPVDNRWLYSGGYCSTPLANIELFVNSVPTKVNTFLNTYGYSNLSSEPFKWSDDVIDTLREYSKCQYQAVQALEVIREWNQEIERRRWASLSSPKLDFGSTMKGSDS